MNKDRRKSISEITSALNDGIVDIAALVEECVGSQIPGTPDAPGEAIETLGYDKLVEDLGSVASKLEDLSGDIESIQDEEQEYFDNMPESFQQGDKGQRAEDAISNLDSARESVDEAAEALREQLEELKSPGRPSLDEVRKWASGESIRDSLNEAVDYLELAAE